MKKTTAFKKFLMKHLWRFQQSQAFVSMIFWSLALAGIFYERTGWYFEHYLGLSADPNKQVVTKMAILMVLVLFMVLVFGFLYDTILRLWEQQNIVGMERNIFAQYKFNVKELLMMKNLYLPILKSVNKGEFDENIAFMERWVAKVLNDDPIARMYFEHIAEWVNSERGEWTPPTLEKLISASKEELGRSGKGGGAD